MQTNPSSPRPRVWGHRGAMDFAPQNTLPAFRLAIEQGADGVELDVQLTKDGVLVVFHDARVDALTDGRGALADLTYAQVKALDAGVRFGRSWRGTRIPTLEEVLAALPPDFEVNVEMKTALSEDSPWDRWLTLVRGPRPLSATRRRAAQAEAAPLADAVAAVLGSGGPRFVVSSFDPLALAALADRAPHLALGFLHSPTVPWDTPAELGSLVHQAWHPHHTQVTAEAVARHHALGHRVNVWTVNDPVQARALAARGVDALITNRPGEILAALV